MYYTNLLQKHLECYVSKLLPEYYLLQCVKEPSFTLIIKNVIIIYN